MRQVPTFLVAVALVCLVLGWWAAERFYAEHIAVLEQRVLSGQAAPPQSVVWPSRGLWAVTTAAVIVALVALQRSRSRRLDATAAAKRVDGMQEKLDAIKAELQSMKGERDTVTETLKRTKKEYALEALRRCSNVRVDGATPLVTIMFAPVYNEPAVAEIQRLFERHVQWRTKLSQSNNLPLAGQFKVVFDVGRAALTYSELIRAFSEGDLLGVPVGCEQTERPDTQNLIVLVLPSRL